MTKQLILFPVLRVVLLLVEHTAQYDWLLYVRFVPHREHRAVFAELRSALLLFEQAAKYYSLLLCNTMNLLYPTQKKKRTNKEIRPCIEVFRVTISLCDLRFC